MAAIGTDSAGIIIAKSASWNEVPAKLLHLSHLGRGVLLPSLTVKEHFLIVLMVQTLGRPPGRRTVGQDCIRAEPPFAPLQGENLGAGTGGGRLFDGVKGRAKSPLPWGYRGRLEAPLIGDATGHSVALGREDGPARYGRGLIERPMNRGVHGGA